MLFGLRELKAGSTVQTISRNRHEASMVDGPQQPGAASPEAKPQLPVLCNFCYYFSSNRRS
jgi:hypothetical protein